MANFKSKKKNAVELVEEWNEISKLRDEQINSKSDKSYHEILIPSILEKIDMSNKNAMILDVGCGTGQFVVELKKHFSNVIGIDPSEESIKIARNKIADDVFRVKSIEEYSNNNKNKYDILVSNMVAMDCYSLDTFFYGISEVLKEDGEFIFTITHPNFWPIYWGYISEDWFTYQKEIGIQSDFVISSEKSNKKTTHFHRPLTMYIKALVKNKLQIEDIVEVGLSDLSASSELIIGEFPRFMVFKCKKKL